MSLALVKEFHQKFGLDYDGPPRMLLNGPFQVRFNHMVEELKEILVAFEKHDLEGVADGLGDLRYLVDGTFIQMGLDGDKIVERIHEANMKKERRPETELVKQGIMKPKGWQPPNLKDLCNPQA